MLVDFDRTLGTLVINDPEAVYELFIPLNKYVDKAGKFEAGFKAYFGEAIIFMSSTEEWAEKRKHLAVSFYKERLNKMNAILVKTMWRRV